MSDDLVRAHTTLGDLDLTVLTDGTYLLDGGAMFGVVPKTLWEKRTPANERNQIVLGTNTVVVRSGKHTVVIETGIGNKLPEKLRSIYDAKQVLLRGGYVSQRPILCTSRRSGARPPAAGARCRQLYQ
jgi:hypothetical protein